MTNHKKAADLLSRFASGTPLFPKDAADLVAESLIACGHTVSNQGFVENQMGVDCYFDLDLDARQQRVAAAVNYGLTLEMGIISVDQAFGLMKTGAFDRVMVIGRHDFAPEVIQRAEGKGAGEIDLFSANDLKGWLWKGEQPEQIGEAFGSIIRTAMRKLAAEIALDPRNLANVEWRDLERILREVFEALGFDVELTRPGKDGGIDLRLIADHGGERQVYLVEVKHWSDQKPGRGHLAKFVEVAISEGADGALFLSSSGFTKTICSGLVEIPAPIIKLGDSRKIISLCRTFYRTTSPLWVEDRSLHELLFSGTDKISRGIVRTIT